MKHLSLRTRTLLSVVALAVGIAGWVAIVISLFNQDQALCITGLALALTHQAVESSLKEVRLDQIESRLKHDN